MDLNSCRGGVSLQPQCNGTTEKIVETSDFCGMLLKLDDSPFASCLNHSELIGVDFGYMCKKDVCAVYPKGVPMKDAACSVVGAVVAKCRMLGFVFDWREETKCGKKIIKDKCMFKSEFIMIFKIIIDCLVGMVAHITTVVLHVPTRA